MNIYFHYQDNMKSKQFVNKSLDKNKILTSIYSYKHKNKPNILFYFGCIGTIINLIEVL